MSWNILWSVLHSFQIFYFAELFCKFASEMSFDFREELRLRTLKVCNHPADKCYSSVFQRLAPCKSDKKEKGINRMAWQCDYILKASATIVFPGSYSMKGALQGFGTESLSVLRCNEIGTLETHQETTTIRNLTISSWCKTMHDFEGVPSCIPWNCRDNY